MALLDNSLLYTFSLIVIIIMIFVTSSIFFNLLDFAIPERCSSTERFDCEYFIVDKNESRLGLTLSNTESSVIVDSAVILHNDINIGTCIVPDYPIPINDNIQINCPNLNFQNWSSIGRESFTVLVMYSEPNFLLVRSVSINLYSNVN